MQIERKFSHDIQGLRALAMIVILFYHARLLPSAMSGAFLSLDIFFAISGFLITRIIYDQVQAGTFSFTQFYIRRIRRLLPAAFITILVTLIAGWFIFGPNAFAGLGREAIHAQFISSNFVFWSESGYFDTESQSKALLHFWSLSVEEQFYLIWPLLIVALIGLSTALNISKKWVLLIAMILFSGLSVWAAQVYFNKDPSAVYYLLPFRAFEFGIGAIVAIAGLKINRLKELGFLAGIAMIFTSFFLFNKESHLPGVYSLLVLAGTSLCLISQGSRLGIILRNPITSSIGNASYSLYLAHWPVFAFYTYKNGLDISLMEKLGLTALALVLGFILHYTVENRMRHEAFWKGTGRILASLVVSGATIYGGAFAWAHYGGTSNPDLLNFNRDRLVTSVIHYRIGQDNRFTGRNVQPIYVLGDSHGRDAANMLNQLSFRSNIRQLEIGNFCLKKFGQKESTKNAQEQACIDITKNAQTELTETPGKAVVLAFRWKGHVNSAYIDRLFTFVKNNTESPVFVIENGVEFDRPIASWADGNRQRLGEPIQAEKFDDLNKALKVKAESFGFTFIPKASLLCPEKTCPYINDEKTLLYYSDPHHLTLDGSAYYAALLKNCRTKSCRQLKKVLR